jgi:hypothetical protein
MCHGAGKKQAGICYQQDLSWAAHITASWWAVQELDVCPALAGRAPAQKRQPCSQTVTSMLLMARLGWLWAATRQLNQTIQQQSVTVAHDHTHHSLRECQHYAYV